jgi:hypothetical protein
VIAVARPGQREHGEDRADVVGELLAVYGQGDRPVWADSQVRGAGGVFELADLAVQGGALDADLACGVQEAGLSGEREDPADPLLGAGAGEGARRSRMDGASCAADSGRADLRGAGRTDGQPGGAGTGGHRTSTGASSSPPT